MKLLQLHIDDDTHREIKSLALEQGVSIRTLILAAYQTHRALLKDAPQASSFKPEARSVGRPSAPVKRMAVQSSGVRPAEKGETDNGSYILKEVPPTLQEQATAAFGRGYNSKPCKVCGAPVFEGQKCLQKHA